MPPPRASSAAERFPYCGACYAYTGYAPPLSPRSMQRAASDSGMDADAQIVVVRAALVPLPAQPATLAGIGGAVQSRGGTTAQGEVLSERIGIGI